MDNKNKLSQGGENENEWKVVEDAAADFNPEAAQKRADEARAEKATEKAEKVEGQAVDEENKKENAPKPNFWTIEEGVIEYPTGEKPMTADKKELDIENCYVIESRPGYRFAVSRERAPAFAFGLMREATKNFDSPKEFATANRVIEAIRKDEKERTKVMGNYEKSKSKLAELRGKLDTMKFVPNDDPEKSKLKEEAAKLAYWEDRAQFYAIVEGPQYEVVKRRYAEKNAENTVKLLENTLSVEQEQLAQLKLGGKAEIDGRKLSKKELKNRIKEREKELAHARDSLGAARANFAIAQNAAIA